MILDPTTNVGKLRLRVGDYSCVPIMPDEVYVSALQDTSNNLPRATKLMARYILGSLTGQTHQKLVQIEIFGNQHFEQYKKFIETTVLNPNFMDYTPLPYTPVTLDEYGNEVEVPLIQFQKEWNENWRAPTDSQSLRDTTIPLSCYVSYM